MRLGGVSLKAQVGRRLFVGVFVGGGLLSYLWICSQGGNSLCWAEGGDKALHPVASGAALTEAELENRFQENGFVLDPKFTECGPTCLYQKSKENLSVQLEYVYRKKMRLEGREGSSLTGAQKRELLGSFCISNTDKAKPSTQVRIDEPLAECLARWQKMTNFWFLKVRGALGENDTSIARLKGLVICDYPEGPQGRRVCKMAEKSGTGFAVEKGVIDRDPKKNGDQYYQAPDISTANELSRLAEESKHLMSVNMHTEQANPELFKPDCRDFIVFEEKEINPVDVTMGKMQVPQAATGLGACEGFAYDQAAFQQATNKWKQVFQDEKILEKNPNRAEALKQSRKDFIKDFKQDPKDPNKSVARQIYDDMHDSSVARENQRLQGESGQKAQDSSLKLKKDQSKQSSLGDGTLAVEFQKVNAKSPGADRFSSFAPSVITFTSSKTPVKSVSRPPTSSGSDAVMTPDSPESSDDGTLALDFD